MEFDDEDIRRGLELERGPFDPSEWRLERTPGGGHAVIHIKDGRRFYLLGGNSDEFDAARTAFLRKSGVAEE